jgi:protein AIR1/2
LDVDHQEDATSSSESQSSNSENESANGTTKPTQNKAPAINWNQASRSAIRTTLGKRKTPLVPAQNKTAFDAVNDKYFRSRSASESEDEAQGNQPAKISNGHQDEDDQSKTYFVYDSEGSESGEVSEGGDSVMLNIGHPSVENDTLGDSEAAVLSNGFALAKDGGHAPKDSLSYRSKAVALAEFTSKYNVAPAVLADLKPKDLQIQARYFFIDRNINDIDLSMPISCTECLEKGHLAFVCPSKEVCCTFLLSQDQCSHYCSV